MTALKALFVSEANEWTGGTAQLLALAQGLKEKGWDLVIGCRPGSGLSQRAGERGLPIFTVPLREDYDLPSAWRLARYIDEQGVPLVHAHHNRSHALCLLAKLILRLRGRPLPKLVVSRRVSFPPGRNPFSRWKYRSPLIDRIVAVAEAVKAVLVEAGVPAERVLVIRSGTDPGRFSPQPPNEDLRRALGLPQGKPLIGKIANASPWKGQTVMLEAASILEKRGRDWHFLFAGRDTASDWMKAEVERLGLGPRVTLAGFRTDVPELLSLLSVSVNAAVRGEGLSGALRESLAMGLPVVASDIAGNRELLAALGKDWLYAPGDASALADRLEAVLDGLDAARKRAARWRETEFASFSLASTIAETDALYRSLLV